MTSVGPTLISSRDNALYKDLRRLAHDSTEYRKQGQVWLEGDHLCRAALARGVKPAVAVFAESFWGLARHEWENAAARTVLVADTLFAGLSALESPAPMGLILDLPAPSPLDPSAATVILDRLQDTGNVGAILRSAAAFGFAQVIALKGTAALWSSKVVRAGMGAHFTLRLVEGLAPDALDALTVPIVTTSSHEGEFLHRCRLPWPCAWALGHEGQGVSAALASRSDLAVRIAQPGGQESLNVASAAAICLHASAAARL